jgi:hypothetical protein
MTQIFFGFKAFGRRSLLPRSNPVALGALGANACHWSTSTNSAHEEHTAGLATNDLQEEEILRIQCWGKYEVLGEPETTLCSLTRVVEQAGHFPIVMFKVRGGEMRERERERREPTKP